MKIVALELGICTALLFGVLGSDALAQAATTAHGVMFAVDLTGDTVIQSSELWSYDKIAAETWYSNTLDESTPPLVKCAGNAASCAPGNAPSLIPPAPAPDRNRLNPIVAKDKCVFFDGGDLSGMAYTQQVTVPGKNGRGNWSYTFTYQIAPLSSPVAARTAWILDAFSPPAPVLITLSGYVAVQSTVLHKGSGAPWTFKTTHELAQVEDVPVLANMQMTVRAVQPSEDGLDVDLVEIYSTPLSHSVESDVDFFFAPNAGIFGAADRIVTGMVGSVQLGEVLSPGGFADDFRGNDGALGDRAILSPASFELAEPGSYLVTVTGTVRGMDGMVELPFGTTELISVMADTCSP